MADLQIPKSIPCQFDAKGWRPCKTPSDNGWCSKHERIACASCGEHAVRGCGEEVGSFICGTPLCATCAHHWPTGTHVTEAVMRQHWQAEREEAQARLASRMSPVRRTDDSGLPLNLFELLKSDPVQDGFILGKVYYLELVHGLMGFFPAVFSEDEDCIVLTTDLETLASVWERMEPRRAAVRERVAYIHPQRGVAYLDAESQEDRENRTPQRILFGGEANALLATETAQPFRWARGFLGGGSMDREDFLRALAESAQHVSPSFRSAHPGS